MSKYLICGDWHGNHQWAKKIIEVAEAEEISKILQVGDFGVWPGNEGKEYLDILSRSLIKRNVRLYFVPGNHEDYNQIDEWTTTLPKNEDGHIEVRENLFYAGKVNAWTWEGKRFASVGGAVSIDKYRRKENVSWWPQEELTALEETRAKDLGRVDYLFTHDSPNTLPFTFLKSDQASEAHRYTMTKIGLAIRPKLWFHGHYHKHAEYKFWHEDGETNVFSLDADSRASINPQLDYHTAVLDTEYDNVFYIRKHFNWWAKAFYFDRKHNKDKCIVCR